ncbi:MAG: DNA-binding protein [Lachnospiraceae bacterium]|nr:DNA-binding protein [Lachnospiraceae bacterium]
MEKIVEQGLLYDFYGELLTKHQQQIYERVVYDNLTLGEIAQEAGVSRQAVHEIVKRCDKILADYEEKLKLVEKFTAIKDKVAQINQLSVLYEQDKLEDRAIYSSQVRKLSAEILQEL